MYKKQGTIYRTNNEKRDIFSMKSGFCGCTTVRSTNGMSGFPWTYTPSIYIRLLLPAESPSNGPVCLLCVLTPPLPQNLFYYKLVYITENCTVKYSPWGSTGRGWNENITKIKPKKWCGEKVWFVEIILVCSYFLSDFMSFSHGWKVIFLFPTFTFDSRILWLSWWSTRWPKGAMVL